MKVRLIAVSRISGIAKATNQPFGPLFMLSILRPLELVDSPKFKQHGNGFGTTEMQISEEVFNKFVKLTIPEGGVVLELTTEMEMGRRGPETVVTGFVAPAPARAAA